MGRTGFVAVGAKSVESEKACAEEVGLRQDLPATVDCVVSPS